MKDRIARIKASVVRGGGADYHDHAGENHWIDDHIATPMSRYPEYRDTRSSWGLNALGTFVVEIEDEIGRVGVGTSTGGVPACWVVEHHLARFVEGRNPAELETIWDQMFRSTLYYGRKGLALNCISAVDLALWDLLGRQRQEPVHQMIGGIVHEELQFYATTGSPRAAKELGFVGAKVPVLHGPAEGEDGFAANARLVRELAELVDDGFFLALDCWMALDVDYSQRLMKEAAAAGFRWVEEPLPADDYWGYAELRRTRPPDILLTTGEHEATRWGFRMLLEMGCADVLQPDVNWCGGLTELLKIAELADSYGVPVVPHGSSVYSYHFVSTRGSSPFAEFLMMSPKGDRVVPMFDPLLVGEPVPENGTLRVPDAPGFGVELNRSLDLKQPFPHEEVRY